MCSNKQTPAITTNCTANTVMYKITVMNQYSPASVTVLANMSSVELTKSVNSIVANREYTITVSAISDQGTSYPSEPVVVSKFFYIANYMGTYSCITTNISYIKHLLF